MGKEELHTAEHVFARALQNLGIDLHVIKVDTENGVLGSAIFNEKIELETLKKAEREVNAVVKKGLGVSEETFTNLEDARAKFPSLRMNEERLKDKETFRLVKIGDYDYSMCKNRHVDNTARIGAFVLKSVSYPESHTKIEFLAADEAVEHMLAICDGVVREGVLHNFEPEELPARYEQALAKNSEAESDMAVLFEAAVGNGMHVFSERMLNLGGLYKVARRYVDLNEGGYVVLLNESQIACLWGRGCSANMKDLETKLEGSQLFKGAIKEDSINGRILDMDRVRAIIKDTLGE